MEIINISKKAQKILQNRGINELSEVLNLGPRTLRVFGIPFNDLYSLRSQLTQHFGKSIYQKGWSKAELRQLHRKENEGSQYGVRIDEGVIQRYIHRTTTGKHYRKPLRRRGIF